jgi:hypothetical protein
MFDKDKYIDLICEAPNWISSNKIYVLPHLTGHLGVVELIILGGTVVVESTHHPIRHGRHCASRVMVRLTLTRNSSGTARNGF